jgi:hypothetical protein
MTTNNQQTANDYLAVLPENRQVAINAVRDMILSNLPTGHDFLRHTSRDLSEDLQQVAVDVRRPGFLEELHDRVFDEHLRNPG